MSNFDEKVTNKLKRLEREVERLRVKEKQVFVPLATPLTSTAWDGDSFSTTAKTKIDLSAVFGVPAGVKAVLVSVIIRDSGSAASDCYLTLSPTSTGTSGIHFDCSGLTNDAFERSNGIIPCDANGDIYYRIGASGVGTLDAYIEIWGYWL